MLSYIFTVSFAIRELGHASTQSPPNTDEEDRQFDNQFIDQNSPCVVVDLEELHLQRSNRVKPKSKGKRRATPFQSSRSNKRTVTTTTDLEIEKWSDEWSEMGKIFNKGLANLEKANGEGSSRDPDLALHAMVLLNEAIAETPVLEENYWKAAHSFMDQQKTKIFIGMTPDMRVGWLQRGINKDV